jgi:ribosomal protein S18 acetylase RimI-like enzyme
MLDMSNLIFRSFKSDTDYQSILAVREGCVEWDNVDPLSLEEGLPTLKELALMFSPARNPNLDKTLCLVEVDSKVIGYHWIRWWQHANGISYWHKGHLLPAWRGRGIGTAMCHWAESSIRAEKEANALLLNEGYEPYHSLIELVHDLQHLPARFVPNNFTLHPALAEHYRSIWEANEEVFEDEPERSLPSEEAYQEFLHQPNFDPALWQVIWADDQVAGVALCEILKNNVGHICQLSVQQRWRRKSIGYALLTNALHTFQERGVKQIRVCIDSDSPFGTQRLHERVGFYTLKEHISYKKPLS